MNSWTEAEKMRRIEKIIDGFDFDKCYKVLQSLGYDQSTQSIEVEYLKKAAIKVLETVKPDQMVYNRSGFVAKLSENGVYSLFFSVEGCEHYPQEKSIKRMDLP